MSRWSNLKTAKTLFLGALFAATVIGCAERSDDGYTLEELIEGIPMDPSMYVLEDVTCEKVEDGFDMHITLTNPTDQAILYSFRPTVIRADGSKRIWIFDGETAGPGETIEVTTGGGSPELWDDPPPCSVEVLLPPVL
jgi:hypothetical protein